jgi:hypothetical protein
LCQLPEFPCPPPLVELKMRRCQITVKVVADHKNAMLGVKKLREAEGE